MIVHLRTYLSQFIFVKEMRYLNNHLVVNLFDNYSFTKSMFKYKNQSNREIK